jgi:toxin-antitoxin system PIN domain toxin
MTGSSRLFLFPDINVWLALSYDRHVHHPAARQWFEKIPSTALLLFCRLTQLGLLRLLGEAAVMGPDQAMSQGAAWKAYDVWLRDERVAFIDEPAGLELRFRALTRSPRASPKDWADSYLAAFADTAELLLVTFDQSLARKHSKSLLLRVP